MDIIKLQLFFHKKKNRESALGLPILTRQYGGSRVIFWLRLEFYRKDFSTFRDIYKNTFPTS